MMIKDSTGNKSMTATFAYVAFGVVMLKFLLAGVVVGSFQFGTVDSLSIAAVLTPTLGAYTVRRLGTPAPVVPPAPDSDNGLGGG